MFIETMGYIMNLYKDIPLGIEENENEHCMLSNKSLVDANKLIRYAT